MLSRSSLVSDMAPSPASWDLTIRRKIELACDSNLLNMLSIRRCWPVVGWFGSRYMPGEPNILLTGRTSIEKGVAWRPTQFTTRSLGYFPFSCLHLHFFFPVSSASGHLKGYAKFLMRNCGMKCWYSFLTDIVRANTVDWVLNCS